MKYYDSNADTEAKPIAKQSKRRTYSEKLLDQRWQKKRLELLEAANWTCQHEYCRNLAENPTLHIHHRFYMRGAEPWDYPDYAYQVACDECHKALQAEMEEAHAALAIHHSLAQSIAMISRIDQEEGKDIAELLEDFMYWTPPLRSLAVKHLRASLTSLDAAFSEGLSAFSKLQTQQQTQYQQQQQPQHQHQGETVCNKKCYTALHKEDE